MPPTRAQQFREEERAKLTKKAPAPTRSPRRNASDDDGARNLSNHGEKKASVATEENHSGTPSRKSTRPSANRGKNSAALELVSRMKSASPQVRHAQRNRHAPKV